MARFIRFAALPIVLLICRVPSASDTADLVAPGAKVQKLAGGFKFTERPAADAQGNVYFSDIPNSRIHKWSLGGKLKTFRENTGRANGLYFDEHGNLYLTHGSVRVYSPRGKLIADIAVPERPANVTFGGKDRKTLFVTARTGFYSVRMDVKGNS